MSEHECSISRSTIRASWSRDGSGAMAQCSCGRVWPLSMEEYLLRLRPRARVSDARTPEGAE